MSEFIAATERLTIRQIKDGDQDLVYNLSQESSLMSNLPKDDEYVKSIYEDLTWLGCAPTGGIFYGSDYFDKCYEFAVQLIKQGK